MPLTTDIDTKRSELLALRLALVRGGYVPIPLYGKTPPVYGKTTATGDSAIGKSSKMYRTDKSKCEAAHGPMRSTVAS